MANLRLEGNVGWNLNLLHDLFAAEIANIIANVPIYNDMLLDKRFLERLCNSWFYNEGLLFDG